MKTPMDASLLWLEPRSRLRTAISSCIFRLIRLSALSSRGKGTLASIAARRDTTLVSLSLIVALALFFGGSLAASAQTVTMGDTNVESDTDGGNANFLLAQQATLSQGGTLQSLSFYVSQASGQLVLGLYDSSGPNGQPGKLLASTGAFTPVLGWNTRTVSAVNLAPGSYWLAYLPSSNNLWFPVERTSGMVYYYSYAFGALPQKFAASPNGVLTNWSFYATLTSSSSTSSSSSSSSSSSAPVNIQLPVITGTAQVGKVLTSSTGTWTGATSYGYQWAGNGTPIAGATAASYTPVSGDAGHTLTATVTATGSGGTASATSAPTVPIVAGSSSGTGGTGGTSNSFVALHTYYISPTGNDSNDGTSPSRAWATPHHPVSCGDVIIAAAGSYTNGQFGTGSWGTVSGCPSTSGGIDGTGGVYFATVLCAGPDITSCYVNGGAGEAFRVDQSNWAVEGFTATQNTTGPGECYTATSETNTTQHHIAFINDIAANCYLAGFGAYSWTSPGGVDQTAVVGVIAYNGAPSGGGLCGSGISLIPVNGPDTSAGTHVFVAGAFSYNNINANGCANPGTTDGEGIIFDSWACSSYKYQGVAEQNMLWGNGSAGFEIFPNCTNANDLATYVVMNNTSYGNYRDPYHTGSANGEVLLLNVTPSAGSYTVTNNIFQAVMGTPGGASQSGNFGFPVYGAEIACTNNCSSKVSVSGNYIWNGHAPVSTSPGYRNTDAWNNGAEYTTSFPFGSNTYNDAAFANPGALPATAPNCSGYKNTTSCMIGAGVVADLTPGGGAAGKGYQPPGACAPDAYFPSWLKGVVYLSWNGSALTENSGLITKPCNM